MIEGYLKRFARLHTDTSPARWSANTNYRAPHKPFLLMAVMDLVAQDWIQTNFIELNVELMDTFELYWVKVMGRDKVSTPLLPFYHLKSDKFWHLVPVPGMEQALGAVRQIRSISQFCELVLGAKLDDALFKMLLEEENRDDLRRVLIETYFAPYMRDKLVEVGKITAESFEYSRELLNRLQGRFTLKEPPEMDKHYQTESRSTAFRRVVVEAYDHACAMCGVRVITPEGRTAVAAAHIVPWSVNRNDDPRNGMALCGLHHWTFDQGLAAVAPDYQILVSPVVPLEQSGAKPVRSLAGRELIKPDDRILWPAQSALSWHRKNIFRAEAPPSLL
jgi:putative restriction endonuclease